MWQTPESYGSGCSNFTPSPASRSIVWPTSATRSADAVLRVILALAFLLGSAEDEADVFGCELGPLSMRKRIVLQPERVAVELRGPSAVPHIHADEVRALNLLLGHAERLQRLVAAVQLEVVAVGIGHRRPVAHTGIEGVHPKLHVLLLELFSCFLDVRHAKGE